MLSFSFSYFALIQQININYLLLNVYHVPWFIHSTIYLCFLVLIMIVILHLSPWLFDYCLFSVDCKLDEIIFLFSFVLLHASWRPSLNIHWINNEPKNISILKMEEIFWDRVGWLNVIKHILLKRLFTNFIIIMQSLYMKMYQNYFLEYNFKEALEDKVKRLGCRC